MEKLKLNISRCKGCYLCMSVCPTKAISISDYVNKKGYAEIQVDQEKCVGCGSCYRMCPDYVFEDYKEGGVDRWQKC